MNPRYLFFVAAAIFLFLGVQGGEKRKLYLILGVAFLVGGALPFLNFPLVAAHFGLAGIFAVLAAGDFIRRGFVITLQQKIWILVAAIFFAIGLLKII